jgi:hypothetical protein
VVEAVTEHFSRRTLFLAIAGTILLTLVVVLLAVNCRAARRRSSSRSSACMRPTIRSSST